MCTYLYFVTFQRPQPHTALKPTNCMQPLRRAIMKAILLARLLFQLAAFAFFAYQMGNAVQKYLRFSTVPQTDSKTIAEAKLPNIFICEKNQFNVKKSEVYGYGNSLNNFLSGSLQGTDGNKRKVSWNGKTVNWPYDTILSTLFLTDTMSTPLSRELKIRIKDFYGANGFCYRYTTTAEILSKPIQITFFEAKRHTIYVVDPARHVYYMINRGMADGDKIETKPKTTQYYFINLQEEHRDPTDGDCMLYGSDQPYQSFAACIESHQDNLFRPMIGCRIPWLAAPSQSEDNCYETINATEEQLTQLQGNLSKIIMSTKSGSPEPHEHCLKPCDGINIYSR